jgi:hypothetical protein
MKRALVVAALVGLAGASAAEEKRRAIVIPTELGGFFPRRGEWRREFTLALEDRLRSARFVIVREPLSATEGECREAECLAGIANHHRADLVVSARVVNDEQRLTSYHLHVALVERSTAAASAVRTRDRTCANCTELQARDALTTLLSSTLANEPVPPGEGAPVDNNKRSVSEAKQSAPPDNESRSVSETKQSAAAPSSASPPAEPPKPYPDRPAPVDEERFSRPTRIAFRSVGIALDALGLLGLVQGFVEVAHDGERVTQAGQLYQRDTAKGQALFFSLGAITLAGGAALTALGWLPPRRARQTVRVVPAISPSGAQVHLELNF